MKNKKLKIVKYPDDFLRRKTRKVRKEEIKNPKFKRLVLDMVKAMEEEKGVGLAAPQVGSDLRLCTVAVEGEVFVLINPEIKSYSRKKDIFEEGCLSFPNQFFQVERPIKVKVQTLNLEGEKQKIKADGFLARVLQHEIDHLDGILVIDRAMKGNEK
ncbi:MAG: peptide deformylase [Candidatus Moranbacteria bacterium]|nr:peptide deformylase [Candidatus Moranbacteria bacterium]